MVKITVRLATAKLLAEREKDVLETWKSQIRGAGDRTSELMTDTQLNEQVRAFIAEFKVVISLENYEDVTQPEYEKLLTMLREISGNRAEQGFTPTETAVFVLSLKETINKYQQEYIRDPGKLAIEVLGVGRLIDKLALYTFEAYVATREKTIKGQAIALEARNPMIMVWDNLIAFPLQGILDTDTMKKFTEEMLQAIPRHQARVVIIDLTAISAMDTATCNRLLQAAEAARLMGSEAVITGITPEVAMTIVRLGLDLRLKTLRELREGIRYALSVMNLRVVEADS